MVSLKEQQGLKKLESASSRECFDLAVQYYEEKKFNLTIKELNKIIELYPNLEFLYYNRGLCYNQKRNYKLALNDYNKAIELNPNMAEAYNERGLFYLKKKDYMASEKNFKKAIDLNSNYSGYYSNLGILYSKMKLHDFAIANDTHAIYLNSEDENHYFNRGNNYLRKGDYELALKDYNKAIDLNPTFIFYFNRTRLLFLKKYIGMIINHYNNKIKLNPSNKNLINRGGFYSLRGDYDLSIKDYNKSIDLKENYLAYYNRAIIYLKKRDYELSLKDFYKYIELKKESHMFSLKYFYNYINTEINEKELYIVLSFLCLNLKKYEEANQHILQAFENESSKEKKHQIVYLENIKNAQSLYEKNKSLEEKNKQLEEAEKELEDTMAMFAHKFRSPLDAIIYNTNHEHNPKLYQEAARTMGGLLDVFSLISSDPTVLKERLKQDNSGESNLQKLLTKTLNIILLHLLSNSGRDKICQHYISYAKAHHKIDNTVTRSEWEDDYFKLEQNLQKQWEQDYSQLINNELSLKNILTWIEQHFFKLEIIGFEKNTLEFKEYGITESFLTVILNEIIINAFKYYSSENKQPVILEWTTNNTQVLRCSNPTIRSERMSFKGSHKGHKFLSALARKINSEFNKPELQDNFIIEFNIPNEYCISKIKAKNELLSVD